MATLEYYQQVEKADEKLNKANAALERFQESRYRGGKLDELRDKEERENLNAKEQAALERLADEEAELRDAVKECRGEWLKSKEDLRQARETTQTASKLTAQVAVTLKRRYTKDEEQEENVRLVKQRLCAPSSVGKLCPAPNASKKRMFFASQEESIILNSRPPNCLGPPIVLYQGVFSQFLNDLNDETLEVTVEDHEWTREFLNLMATSYSGETDRWKAFNEHFSKLIGYTVETANTDGTRNDGIIFCTIPSFGEYGARIILEMKNEIGEGNNDPTIQAAVEYAKFWADGPHAKTRGVCNCPSLVLAVAGPWFCVLGAVYLERPVIEPLTDFVQLIPTSDRHKLLRIARLFIALRLADKHLDDFYKTLVQVPDNEQYRCQRFYPHPRQYISENGPVQFNYESWLTDDQEKLVFKAIAGDTPLVVKFTQRYNADAHRLCAGSGHAPKLLYVGENEVRGWKMIVMEYIDGPTLYMAQLDREAYNAVLVNVKEAVQKLHEQDIVFGDLRSTNIIINEARGKRRAMLVDFDWAGNHHKDCYPYVMNPEIKWAPGVKGNTLMDKAHDIYWLNLLEALFPKI